MRKAIKGGKKRKGKIQKKKRKIKYNQRKIKEFVRFDVKTMGTRVACFPSLISNKKQRKRKEQGQPF